MSTKNLGTALLFFSADAESIADALDACVRDAIRGDRRAIGRIAMALGGFLHDEARAALGPRFEQGASDVVQELYLGLLEGRFTFPGIRGCATVWMRRVIRMLAAEVAREMGNREPEPDPAA
jgi:DNA-directed RNA polymerase specialized sigma24 family protein